MIQASSPVRHAAYEIFKYLHIALVIIFIIGIYYHLKLEDLPQLKLLWEPLSFGLQNVYTE